MKYFKVEMFVQGERIVETFQGENVGEIINKVKEQYGNPFVVSIKESGVPLKTKINLFKETLKSKLKKGINIQSYYSSLDQLAGLVKAGIPFKEALEELAKSGDKNMRKIFQHVSKRIDKGDSVEKAFSAYKELLGPTSMAMFRLADKTGDLAKVLRDLSEIYKKIYETKRKIKKALRYPIITLTAIVIAFTLLMIFVIPKFEMLFKQYHAKLPLPSRILIFLQHITVNYGPYILIGFFGLIVIGSYLYKINYKFKTKTDEITLKIPIFGPLIYYYTLSMVFTLLYNLYKAGVNMIDSLQIAKETTNNEVVKKKLSNIIIGIKTGQEASEVFANSGLLDLLSIKMLIAGERAGELDRAFLNIQKYYEEKADNITDNLSAYLEPFMLGIIAGLVLLIALGVFLPMWDMGQAVMGHQ